MPTKKGGAGGRRMPLLDARMNTTEERKLFKELREYLVATNDAHQQVIVRRLERTLMAFFLLATVFAIVVYVTAPSIYTNILLLHPSPTDRYPFVATLFLMALVVFIAVLLIGVRQHWRWLFWLLLIAFSAMILDVPATILQLTGVVPSLFLFPVWYSLCRMGVSLLAVIIAAWMLSIYRHYGVWALGKKKKTHLQG